ncbi:hypothetical protein TUM20984_45400 [Mycobacterium antarcticum]|nr:hypothetical protein TUM20984_45400 [Mycolicibacterium sp. TUM20984]
MSISAVVRTAVGGVYLAVSDSGQPMDRHAREAVRIIGAGQLIRAFLTAGPGGPRRLVVSMSMDVVHAVAMLVLAGMDGRRRAALGEAGLAVLLAGSDYRKAASRPGSGDAACRAAEVSAPSVAGLRGIN